MTDPHPPMATRILPYGEAAIAQAAAVVAAGGCVAVPTETVYGLAADATDAAAVAGIYAAKGRPSFNPLIVHVADRAAAEAIALFDCDARALADAFWPGPLTLVLPLRAEAGIAGLVTAGLDSVAVRVPRHRAMQALLAATGKPLANRCAMGVVGALARELLLEVVNAKRHHRESVGGTARGFCIESGSCSRRNSFGSKNAEDCLIDFFDPVVALLVVTVDRSLNRRYAGVGYIRTAGDVFLVPEQKVELMLLASCGQEPIVGIVWIASVPARGGVVLQLGDLLNQQGRIGQHGGPSTGAARRGAEGGGGMIEIPRKRSKTTCQQHHSPRNKPFPPRTLLVFGRRMTA